MSANQLTLFVTFKIDPERIEDFKAAHRPVWVACAAEPECLFFDVFQDPQEQGKFRFVEVWSKGREWFEKEQMTKPYYEEMWPKSQATWLEPPVIEFMRRGGEACTYKQEFLEGGKKSG